ncbi:hypothetical protein ASZ90_018573 [hydrocarbon metagenome]|uniref:Uncharacterized protein n=1 Tax=hydrocarbon metagenome TaxID=938273 RepID=A0A0W8E5Z8_9ZZZZ
MEARRVSFRDRGTGATEPHRKLDAGNGRIKYWLNPLNGVWYYLDPIHDSWEHSDYKAGEVSLS